MNIYEKKEENGRLEFASWFQKTLLEILDPYRRVRPGEFSSKRIEKECDEAYFRCLGTGKAAEGECEKTIQSCARSLLLVADEEVGSYLQTKHEYSITPNLLVYQDETEEALRKTIRKILAL